MSEHPADQPTVPAHDPNIKHMADDINVPALVISGVVTTVLVLAFIFGVQALYYYTTGQIRQAQISDPERKQYRESTSKINEQLLKLNKPDWVDKENNIVTIPIDTAMKLVVEEWSQD
jgi:hypothetical protein